MIKKREKTFVVAPFNLTERSNNTCYTKTEPNVDEKNEEMTHKIQKTDIDELIRLRIKYMIDDFGSVSEEEREGMEKQLPDYFEKTLTYLRNSNK